MSNELHIHVTYCKYPSKSDARQVGTGKCTSVTLTYTPPTVRARHRKFNIEHELNLDELFEEVTDFLEEQFGFIEDKLEADDVIS